jgi:NAD(P)-dependent dehydrogenase (short-subunit alcohol dehydrogenase family)
MPTAVVTGGSRGLGLALIRELAARRWNVIVDARNESALLEAVTGLPDRSRVLALGGDVADEAHRRELGEAVHRYGDLDLLVNNASVLGPSPLLPLERHPIAALEHVLRVNVLAPLALIQSGPRGVQSSTSPPTPPPSHTRAGEDTGPRKQPSSKPRESWRSSSPIWGSTHSIRAT